jgi:hypothetical protein
MKLFHIAKDGGSESNVTGYWLIESKMFFSIALLRFSKSSREAFHNHAFNAVSWMLKGELKEDVLHYPGRTTVTLYSPSIRPIYTSRKTFHKVFGIADTTWVFTLRGPWKDTWQEFLPKLNKYITLTNGRKIINENSNN